MIPIKLLNRKWPPGDGEFRSTLTLTYDDWNDYNYLTSFIMYYCDSDKQSHEIGNVKIYFWENDRERNTVHNRHTRLSLGEQIKSLDDDFYCSLGQDLSYYKCLKWYLPDEYIDILRRLNDIAIFDEIRERFIHEHGVQSSLLRFSSAEKALNEAKEIIFEGMQTIKDMSFGYRVIVPYDTTPTVLRFNFKQTDVLPYRINILIGKNGTGKTQILSRLANSLSGYTDDQESGMFADDQRPPVDKVMSISYSAFDSFKKPAQGNSKRSIFSYIYCGIQSEQGTLSLAQLKANLQDAYYIVKKRDRKTIWQAVLSELMEPEHQETVRLILEERFDDVNLSSGQQILICTITELIANIENESMILFDEPEIHLHPNAVSNIIRMFYRLLEEFDSYAIFSTHSPLILQEIPSKYIQILDRMDGALTIRKPDIECFGNNISEIVFHIFDVTNTESNYKSYLRELCKEKSLDEIVELFDGKLSLNALIYLKNYCGEED